MKSDRDSAMIVEVRKSYSRQLGAGLKMLEKTMIAANEGTWLAKIGNMPFCHLCYHVLWYTDFYFHGDESTFRSPSFHRNSYKDLSPKEQDWLAEIAGFPMPRDEVLGYHKKVRQTASRFIGEIDGSFYATPSPFAWHGFPKIDIVDYNLRHIHHHLGQLNALLELEQKAGSDWLMFRELEDR